MNETSTRREPLPRQPTVPGMSLAEQAVFGRTGLSPEEIQHRRAAGQNNASTERTSRRIADILRTNVLTLFNFIYAVFFTVVLIAGSARDALFGGVPVANGLIGIIQEIRAKRALDGLHVLSAAKARLLRGGVLTEVPIEDVVVDDVLEIGAGDQIIVDGTLLVAEGLEINESLVTGESVPVVKGPGDAVLSGSYVAAGHGRYRATAVGAAAYAAKLGAEVRRYKQARSEIQAGIRAVLRVVSWSLLPLAPLLFFTQRGEHGSLDEALVATVAGLVAIIPMGLMLLTNLAYATAALRLAGRGVLLQDLASVEALARADVICLDKTGTITRPDLSVYTVETFGIEGTEPAIAALAGLETRPNASLSAIAQRYPESPGWTATAIVPFSADRRWSGASFVGNGSWILGAPDVLLAALPDSSGPLAKVAEHTRAGRRVLALVQATGPIDRSDSLPTTARPAALIVLAEELRPEAAETLQFFAAEVVALKVISGDFPGTVQAVALAAGLPGAEVAADARELPREGEALRRTVEDTAVFGRARPEDKVAIIAALRANGHVVAMVGDGVNDVPALKAADIGIAMGSGSPVARGTAQVVLVRSDYDSVPFLLAEGRRVIANVERLAALFVTETVYALLLALAASLSGVVYPFLPRHLTLIGVLTVGLPAFFLALAPSHARAEPRFLARVLRFAVPAGVLAFGATFAAYLLSLEWMDANLGDARTIATLTLLVVGLWVLAIVARPVTLPKGILLTALALTGGTVFANSPLRAFFAFEPASLEVVSISMVAALLAGVALEFLAHARIGRPARELPRRESFISVDR